MPEHHMLQLSVCEKLLIEQRCGNGYLKMVEQLYKSYGKTVEIVIQVMLNS